MLKLTLTTQQLDGLLAILDLYVKTGGLSVLQNAVGLYNLLNSVEHVPEVKKDEEEVPF